MTGPRTFWHLEAARRMPSPYEIATSKLLYYPERGFEVDVPVKGWYERHQRGSPFTCADFDRFVDPRQTTYSRYVELQAAQEGFLDGVSELIERTDADRGLPRRWVEILDDVVPQLRYLFHGLQMVAAYVGQMAPSGRITMAAAFQAADEMRRIQRMAYRMRQLQLRHPGFGERSKAKWQEDPAWQPLRKLVEELLVTYDWGEAFVALNLVVKPRVDRLFHADLAQVAQANGDFHFGSILLALGEDCAWHAQWSEALLGLVVGENPRVQAAVDAWKDAWQPKAAQACAAAGMIVRSSGEAWPCGPSTS